jgi:hypothetical protein
MSGGKERLDVLSGPVRKKVLGLRFLGRGIRYVQSKRRS